MRKRHLISVYHVDYETEVCFCEMTLRVKNYGAPNFELLFKFYNIITKIGTYTYQCSDTLAKRSDFDLVMIGSNSKFIKINIL